MDRSRVEALQATAMFGAVDEEVVGFVVERAEHRQVHRRDYFFHQGDAGGSAYLLDVGSVSVVKEWGGHEQLLRHLGAGDCFGEVALLDFGPRSASVRADTNCSALEVTATLLREVARTAPQQFALIYMNLGREIGRRLRDADDRLFRSRIEAARPDVAEGYSFAVM